MDDDAIMSDDPADPIIPEMQPVSSSNVAGIGRSGASTYVQFKDGAVYRYDGVEDEHHDALLNADSVGSHLAKVFRARYTGVKV